MPEPGRRNEIEGPVIMPEKIKPLWDVAEKSGFVAAKRETDGSYRFIASKGDGEVWLTVNSDGNKVDRLQTVDPKTKVVVSHADGETIEKWVDLLAGAGVNAKEGVGAYMRIEPIKGEFYAEQPHLKGIGVTFRQKETGGGKYIPTSLGSIEVG